MDAVSIDIAGYRSRLPRSMGANASPLRNTTKHGETRRNASSRSHIDAFAQPSASLRPDWGRALPTRAAPRAAGDDLWGGGRPRPLPALRLAQRRLEPRRRPALRSPARPPRPTRRHTAALWLAALGHPP